MIDHLTFALSCLPPHEAERAELAQLYPSTDDRWHQKMDRTRLLVTVRDGALLVAAGQVHDSILAPTSAMDALELGSMAVRPEYRRLGIRQHVTAVRLEFALAAGGTPITIINAANPASWAYYERTELWERERSFEQDGHTKFIYRATGQAHVWAARLPHTATDRLRGLVPAAAPVPFPGPIPNLDPLPLAHHHSPAEPIAIELGLMPPSAAPTLHVGPAATVVCMDPPSAGLWQLPLDPAF